MVVPDVTKTNHLDLVATHWSGVGGHLPSGLELYVSGHIDGTAYVSFTLWETQRLSGDVQWRIGKDWFETNCVFHYYPENVQGGSLAVRYRFQ